MIRDEGERMLHRDAVCLAGSKGDPASPIFLILWGLGGLILCVLGVRVEMRRDHPRAFHVAGGYLFGVLCIAVAVLGIVRAVRA
jgi:hypothetical protein